MNVEHGAPGPETEKQPSVLEGTRKYFCDVAKCVSDGLASLKESLRPVDTSLSTELSKQSAEKMRDVSRGYFGETDRLLLVLAIAGATGLEDYSENEIVVSEESGEKVYHHSDPETEHILNYIGGKEALTEEEQLVRARAGIQPVIELLAFKHPELRIPDNFEEMSREELRYFIAEALARDSGHGVAEQEVEKYFPKPTHEFDPVIYEMVWRVNSECGVPKIRWASDTVIQRGLIAAGVRPERDSHYNGVTNTITLGNDSDFDKVFAEAAHAKQWSDEPVMSTLKVIESVGRTIATAVAEQRSLTDAYQDEYEREGSVEFNAHKIIEDQFFTELREKQKIADARKFLESVGNDDAGVN